jgi:hypothetical protein
VLEKWPTKPPLPTKLVTLSRSPDAPCHPLPPSLSLPPTAPPCRCCHLPCRRCRLCLPLLPPRFHLPLPPPPRTRTAAVAAADAFPCSHRLGLGCSRRHLPSCSREACLWQGVASPPPRQRPGRRSDTSAASATPYSNF